MRRFSPAQFVVWLVVPLGLWALLAGGALFFGSGRVVSWPTAIEFRYRLDCVLMASLVGAGLSAAGLGYQAILRNPLAEPYLLGVSSGAMLAGYLWRLPWFAAAVAVAGALSQQGAAFAGALLAVAVVLGLASRRGRIEPVTLLLVGVIVNATNVAAFMLVDALNPELTGQGGGPLRFLVGGIQTNLMPAEKWAGLGVLVAGLGVLLWLAPALNVAALSEGEARALGVRIHRVRWLALGAASLMTASAVALSGPIGFVGLVCPHLARLIAGHDHRKLIPLATALGAGLLTVADTASRCLILKAGRWLPVGILTGLLGGPFFLALLWRERRRSS